jgi:GNAT superfamily N-acetyltransferase
MNIRIANIDDVPSILSLIHELAVFEKEPMAVKTTTTDLIRDGFGENPKFHCIVADENQHLKGFALFFYTWSTWEGRPTLYLEDLFVKENARGLGIGLALLKNLAQRAVKENCKRFEWAVLDWNTPARDFYHSLGAYHKKEWLPYRLEGEKLHELASE